MSPTMRSLLAIGLAAMPAVATALEPILVTASPAGTTAAQALHSLVVITREDIQDSPADNLADLLAHAGGVHLLRRGAPGVQADAGIRGSSFEQLLVLVDGMPVQNPQTGHHNLNVPVPLAHIERIEIIKGPGALHHGGSTTGGVINILTRRPQQAEAGAGVSLGSHASRAIEGHYGTPAGASTHLLSARFSRTDGESAVRPSDADLRSALYTGQAEAGDARLAWGAGATHKEFGAWGFYSDAYPDARERIGTRLAWGEARLVRADWQLASGLYWHNDHDLFSTRIGASEFVNRHHTRVFGLKADARHDGGRGVTAAGLDLRQAAIDSSALAAHRRRQASLWLLRRQELGEDWRLELGLNRVHYEGDGGWWLPSAALAWQFTPQWQAFASAARSARVPSYTELYMDTAANRGNPALQPERTRSAEAGIAGAFGDQQLSGALFRRSSDRLIDWARRPGEATWQAGNFPGYQVRGVELDWRWLPDLPALHSLRLHWERLLPELDSGPLEVAYALQLPRHTLSAQLTMPLARALRLSVHARRPSWTNQASATLADARLAWRGPRVELALDANNLFDRRPVESGFAPIPGRWFSLGVDVRF